MIKINIRFIGVFVSVFMFLFSFNNNIIRAEVASVYRGSFLMWTRDNVEFDYDGEEIIYSYGYQESGWIFPNIARNLGINKYYGTYYKHKYIARNVIGAGIPTPWGDVKIYETRHTNKIEVRGDGTWSGYGE